MAAVARWIGYLMAVVAGACLVALAIGFGYFVSQISDRELRIDKQADGIVVLTGAASRIPDAIQLLVAQHGKRLLITGVHRDTRAAEIARLTLVHESLFNCCVDLDRSALNTLGNAIETRRWAREKNFSSLIIVTSNWHMPRALVEIAHELPGTELIAFPVIPERSKNELWWMSGSTIRLYLSEYLKYAFAVLRLYLDPDMV